MRKKALSLLLSMILLLSMTLFAIAEGLDDVSVSYVSYTSSAVAVTTLTAGQTITISATVTNKNTDKELVLSTALKRNGVFEDVATDKKIAIAGVHTLYSVTMTIPSDITGCVLETTVWQDFVNMKPICNLGTFPSSNTNLIKIAINGETVTGFSNDLYTYTKLYPKGSMVIPKVTYLTEDNSTKVTMNNPIKYPAAFNIVTSAANGVDNKSFKLDLTRIPYAITGLTVVNSAGGSIGVGGEFSYLSPPNVAINMQLWTDRPWMINSSNKQYTEVKKDDFQFVEKTTITDAGKAFVAEGGTVVKVPVAASKIKDSLPTVLFYTFEIEHTAEILVVFSDWVPNEANVIKDWTDRGWTVKNLDNEGKRINLFTMYNPSDPLNINAYNNSWFNRVLSKTYEVEEGKTTKVEINNIGAEAAFGYFIVVRYIEN